MMNSKIDELEKNINISLANISANGGIGAKSEHKENQHMHKGYKLDQQEKWNEGDASKFLAWKMLATRYLHSGPKNMERMLKYAEKQ